MDPLGFGKDVEKSTNSAFQTARNFGTVHSVPEKTVFVRKPNSGEGS